MPPGSDPRAVRSEEGRDERALVRLGEFGRAHGLAGEVRIKSFTADPAAIARYGPLTDERGGGIVLKAVRPAGGAFPDMLIARVEGVATRAEAEALNGRPVFVARDRLPAPDDADEFFLADLIGLPVEDTGGQALGTIVAVPNYGAGDLLEIAPCGGGPSALLPFTEAFVPVVDVPARRIVIDPPERLFEPDQDAPDLNKA